MSEDQTQEFEDELPTEEERRVMLFARAKMMGIPHSNNISNDALAARIEAKQTNQTPEPDETDGDGDVAGQELSDEVNPLVGYAPSQKKSLRQQILEDAMRLVRVRITNLNPQKKDLPGEIFTLANGVVGTIRKFVPYGEVTQNGYHIPYCIYKRLKNRRFLHIRTTTDPITKKIKVSTTWALEFGLEVLPQLTEHELKKLGNAQLAAGSFETEEEQVG